MCPLFLLPWQTYIQNDKIYLFIDFFIVDLQVFWKILKCHFFRIIKIPSNDWLELVWNLHSFFYKISQQIEPLEASKVLAY